MYKVIIIDDEPIIVQGLSRSIPWKKWDCEVVATANDGFEGKKLIEEHRPDMIFLDICMPQMDGLTMIAAIKSEFPDLQISILTGFRDFDYAQQAIRLGVTRFLLKPSNMAELEESIEAMCHKAAQKQRADATKRPADSGQDAKKEPAACADAGESGREEKVISASGSFIVKNALEYIEKNYQNKLTLGEVAEKTYVSQWHLSKLLNKHTGQSFSELLNHVRIEHAKELLKNPALRIGDISEQVGFLDLAHFSRVFKKQEGISANEYRNQKLGG